MVCQGKFFNNSGGVMYPSNGLEKANLLSSKLLFRYILMENSGFFKPLNEQQNERNYKQMGNKEFDGEINDKEIVLDYLKVSTQPSATVCCCANTIPLLCMNEEIQKDNEIYRSAVKINGLATVS